MKIYNKLRTLFVLIIGIMTGLYLAKFQIVQDFINKILQLIKII